MKILHTRFLVVLLCMWTLSSCYKDKGNYDYTDINTVTLGDPINDSYYVLQFDTLRLNPVISQTIPVEENALQYEWSIRKVDNSVAIPSFEIVILSNERNLDAPITVAPGTYRLIYKVTDPNTEISSYLFYEVVVGTNFSQGWLVLQQFEQESTADVSLLVQTSESERVIHHVYESVNGVPLHASTSRMGMGSILIPKEYYFLSDEDGVEIDRNSFAKIKDFDDWFFTAPTVAKPSVYSVFSPPTNTTRTGIMVNDGLVHIKRYGGFPGSVLFGGSLLYENDINYSMAPYFMVGDHSTALYMGAFYETISKRFVALKGPAGALTATLEAFPTPGADAPFDPNNIGMDLIYAGPTNTNYLYSAMLRDAAGDHYVYQLNLLNAQVAGLKTKMNISVSGDVSAVENSRSLGYIYYAVQNKIYLYQIGPNSASEIFSFPAGEEVTKIKIDPNYAISKMMVGTWNGTEGKLYDFTLSVTGTFENGTYNSSYDGLGKIVDIMYKPE